MRDSVGEPRDWFAYGDRDLQAAKTLLAAGGAKGIVGMLIQQAVEKYLKGYLIYHGWKLQKTHDLRRLLAEAISYDPTFAEFRDFGRRATAYYLEYRYPPPTF